MCWTSYRLRPHLFCPIPLAGRLSFCATNLLTQYMHAITYFISTSQIHLYLHGTLLLSGKKCLFPNTFFKFLITKGKFTESVHFGRNLLCIVAGISYKDFISKYFRYFLKRTCLSLTKFKRWIHIRTNHENPQFSKYIQLVFIMPNFKLMTTWVF